MIVPIKGGKQQDDRVDETIKYYNLNAENFFESTVDADMSAQYHMFEKYLGDGAHILDCGCGSGRDSKHFLESGFEVTAIDGSEELCQRASELTGIDVQHMYFQDIDFEDEFDGVWACASLLHVEEEELPEVLEKIVRALRDGGVLYASFKYGDFSGERGGRYFNDLSEDSFEELLGSVPGLTLQEKYITADVRPGREEEQWLNIIAVRKAELVERKNNAVEKAQQAQKADGQIVCDENNHRILKVNKGTADFDFKGTLDQVAQVVNIANIVNAIEKGAEYVVQVPAKYQKQLEAGELFINKNATTGIEWPALMKKAENGRYQFVDNLPIKQEEFIKGNPFQDICNGYHNIVMERQIAQIAEAVEEACEIAQRIEVGQQDDRVAKVEAGKGEILRAMVIQDRQSRQAHIDQGLNLLCLGKQEIGKALKRRVENFEPLPNGKAAILLRALFESGYLDKKDREVEEIQECYSMYYEATKMLAATYIYEGEVAAAQQIFSDSIGELAAIDFSNVKTIERAHAGIDLGDWFFNNPVGCVKAEQQMCLESSKETDYLQIEVSGEDLLEAIENAKQEI